MGLPRLLAIGSLAVLCAAPAGAELWRWTDADGIVRYTPNPSRVPQSARGSLARVEPGMTRVARPTAPVPGPAVPDELYVPQDEFSFAADPFNAPDQARTLRGDAVPEPLEPTATAPLGAAAAPSNATASPNSAGSAPSNATASPSSAGAAPSDAAASSSIARAAPRNETASPSRAANAAASTPQGAASTATPAPAPPPVASAPPPTAAQHTRRFEIEAQIARDEARLKELISTADGSAGEPTDELREIAARLPELQSELRELEGGATSSSDTRRP